MKSLPECYTILLSDLNSKSLKFETFPSLSFHLILKESNLIYIVIYNEYLPFMF